MYARGMPSSLASVAWLVLHIMHQEYKSVFEVSDMVMEVRSVTVP